MVGVISRKDCDVDYDVAVRDVEVVGVLYWGPLLYWGPPCTALLLYWAVLWALPEARPSICCSSLRILAWYFFFDRSRASVRALYKTNVD